MLFDKLIKRLISYTTHNMSIRDYLPENIQPFLGQQYYGNELENWLNFSLVFVLTIFGLWVLKHLIITRIRSITEKSKTTIDDILVDAINTISFPLYIVLAFFASSKFLSLDELVINLINGATLIVATIYATIAIQKVIMYAILRTWEEKKDEVGFGKGFESFLKNGTGIILWSLSAIIIMQNLGYDLSTLIGGLGIAGIAIAFALQNVLSDMFAYVTIYLDKPFQIGDFVVFEDEMGTVTEIGTRSTRIQTLQGQELVVTNKQLTSAKINNYGKMPKRRIAFHLGVTYETDREQLNEIPGLIRKIIKDVDNCTLDRVHFYQFGDFSLDFEIVYYVDTGNYNDYMDVQQNINYAIIAEFDKRKIEFAYPTQVIYNIAATQKTSQPQVA